MFLCLAWWNSPRDIYNWKALSSSKLTQNKSPVSWSGGHHLPSPEPPANIIACLFQEGYFYARIFNIISFKKCESLEVVGNSILLSVLNGFVIKSFQNGVFSLPLSCFNFFFFFCTDSLLISNFKPLTLQWIAKHFPLAGYVSDVPVCLCICLSGSKM